MTLTKYLNDLAGTDGLQDQGAANALAGTNGLALVGALNAAAGTSGLELQGALGRLGGVPGVAPDGALSEMAFIKRTAPALWLDARFPNGFGGSIPADGSALGQWNDLSGNGRHATQGTAANQPLYRSANPNLLTYNQATVETDTTGFYSARGTIARSTTYAYQGAASLAHTVTDATNDGYIYTGPLGLSGSPVSPSTQYTASAVIRTETGVPAGRQAAVGFYWYDSGGTFISAMIADASTIDTTWQQKTYTATSPSNAAYCNVFVYFKNGRLVGEVFYVDAIGLREGSSTTWVPPVTLPNGYPTVQFGGVSRLESDAVATVFSGNDPTYTVYAVAVRDAAVTNHMSITGAGTVASTTRNTNLRFDTVNMMEYAATDDAAVSQIVTGGTACSIAAAKVMSFAVGANIDQYLNGTSDAASTAVTTGTFTYDSFGVGAIRYNAAWVNYLHGGISALLVYSGAHDTATRQRIERAIGRIYGVTVA